MSKPCARLAHKVLAGCTPSSSDSKYFFSPINRKNDEESHDIIVEMATSLALITQADVWIAVVGSVLDCERTMIGILAGHRHGVTKVTGGCRIQK